MRTLKQTILALSLIAALPLASAAYAQDSIPALDKALEEARQAKQAETPAPIAVPERTSETLLQEFSKPEAEKAEAKPAEVIEAQPAAALAKPSPDILSAAPNSKEDLLSKKESSSMPWLRTVLAFLFVSSLIIVAGSFFNGKLKGSKYLPNAKSARVIQNLSLGLKRQLTVVDFEGTRLVIGVTGTTMQLIYAKEAPGSAEAGAPVSKVEATAPNTAAAPAEPEAADFASKIRQAVQAMKPLTPPFSYTGKNQTKAKGGVNRLA